MNDELREAIVADALADAMVYERPFTDTMADALAMDRDGVEVDECVKSMQEHFPGSTETGFVFELWVGDERRRFSVVVQEVR